MAKAIVARRKGDEYQARVFWLNLLHLRTGDYVQSVSFESDRVSFVDDVVVSYREPIKDWVNGKQFIRELFQCKYHMTQNKAFTHENLIDCRFINSKKDSMLKRLYDAYLSLSDELGTEMFRLYIFSNWNWDTRDALAKHLHEEMLRSTFYENGERTEEGKARSKFAQHLAISQEELRPFLDIVRFRLGKNLVDLAGEMAPYLKLAGLRPIDPTVTSIIYDDLAWKLFGQERNSFDRDSFDKMIREEKLMVKPPSEHSEISIQSFSQLARRPHDLQAAHLDLCNLFGGRFPLHQSYWKKEIPEKVTSFILDEKLRDLPQPIHFFFDCHLSIAFLAGHLISPKFGIEIIPVQKSGANYELWERPSNASETKLWNVDISGYIDTEVVVGVSVTHPIENHLNPFLEAKGLNNIPKVLLRPVGEMGRTAVSGGNNAWQLGFELGNRLREILPHTCHKMHFFFAGPVALAYILGHTLRHVTQVIHLYEHDFEGETGGLRYYPSMRIPINLNN